MFGKPLVLAKRALSAQSKMISLQIPEGTQQYPFVCELSSEQFRALMLHSSKKCNEVETAR